MFDVKICIKCVVCVVEWDNDDVLYMLCVCVGGAELFERRYKKNGWGCNFPFGIYNGEECLYED